MDKNSVVKNRLELNRKTSGYSQREVAQILGFSSVAQISRWERGEKDPNLKHALQLSALYKRLVNDLFWDSKELCNLVYLSLIQSANGENIATSIAIFHKESLVNLVFIRGSNHCIMKPLSMKIEKLPILMMMVKLLVMGMLMVM